MMMSLLSWVRCVVAIAFLCNMFNTQETEQNKTASLSENTRRHFYKNCACSQKQSYNLPPLGRDDGLPRFTASGSDQWMYSFNPCVSFSLGPRQRGGCFRNVAVCRWPKNKASYQNIGKQTTVRCDVHNDTKKPRLVYTNEKIPNWKTVVTLKCEPSKKAPEEAEFILVNVTENKWHFRLVSVYACPNASTTVAPSTTEATGDVKPTPPDDTNKLMYIWLPICAVSCLVITVPLAIYIKRNWRCIRRENGQENERQPLNRGNVIVDYAANHLNEPAEVGGLDNSQNEPQPSSASNRSCSNIRVANKENFNRRSNVHHSKAVLG